MNFCPNCGTQIPNPDDLFCMNCGTRLHQDSPAPETTDTPPQPPTQAPAAVQQSPAPPVQPPVAAPEAPPAPARPATPQPASPAAPRPGSAPAAGAGVSMGKTAEFTISQAFRPLTPQPQTPAQPAPLFPQQPAVPPAAEKPGDLLHLIDEVQAGPVQAPTPQEEPAPAPSLFGEGGGQPKAPTPGAQAQPAPLFEKPAPAPGLFGEVSGQPQAPATATPAQPAPLFEEPTPAPGLFGEGGGQPQAPAPGTPAQSAPLFEEPTPAPSLFGEAGGQPKAPTQSAPVQPQAAPPQKVAAEPAPKADAAPQPRQPQPAAAPAVPPQQEAPAQAPQKPVPPPPTAAPAATPPPQATQQIPPPVPLPGQPPPASQPAAQAPQQTMPLPQQPVQQAIPRQQVPAQQTQQGIFAGQAAYPAQQQPATREAQSLFAGTVPPARRTPTPPPLPLPEDDRPRRSPGKIVLTVVIVVLIFAIAVCATTLIMLYFGNRPAKTVDAFAEAISTADYAKLNELAAVQGATPTEAGWDAFCAAFDDSAGMNRLRSQLLKQADDPTAVGESYPAVSIVGEEFFLFIKKYYITVQGVQLLAPGAQDGTQLLLDDIPAAPGVYTNQGVLYAGLMPGLYNCALVPPGTDATTVEGTLVELFSVNEPNRLESTDAVRATVTVENCLTDLAEIYVNGVLVAEVPVDGVVTLPDVALGSTIRIEAMDGADIYEASVVFSDMNATALRFDDYHKVGDPIDSSVSAPQSDSDSDSSSDPDAGNVAAALTKNDIDAVLVTFYNSYLSCINAQSLDGIRLSTAHNNTFLATRITQTGNASNLFEYSGASCDEASITVTEIEGLPAVNVNGTFSYRYKPREGAGDYQAASNKQSVQLVYQDGEWRVNRMVFVSDADYTAHKIGDFNAG